MQDSESDETVTFYRIMLLGEDMGQDGVSAAELKGTDYRRMV